MMRLAEQSVFVLLFYYLWRLVDSMINVAKHTREIKSSIAMAKAASNKKTLFTSKLA